MTLEQAMAALRAAGSEKTRNTYARHGVTREMFGVSYADLEKLRKKIKTDQELAGGVGFCFFRLELLRKVRPGIRLNASLHRARLRRGVVRAFENGMKV